MFHFCNIAKALSDENRVRILMALLETPLCVCQLTAFLDLAPSTTSKHLSVLRTCQLIECKKSGRWTYYILPEKPANDAVKTALDWVKENLMDNEHIIEDKARIYAVLQADPCALGESKDNLHSAYIHCLAEKNELNEK